MATLSLSGGIGGFSWGIYDLQHPVSTYQDIGITRYDFQEGASSISGIVDQLDDLSSSNYSTGYTWINYDPGTYTFYGYAKINNLYYHATSDTVTVSSSGGDEPDIDVSFSCSSTSDSITVKVLTDSDVPYYKIFCRRADNSGDTETIPYSGFDYHSESYYYETFTGLEPSTEYAVNVQYSPTGEPNSGTLLIKKYVWTEDEATPTVDRWNWYGTNETSISDHRNPASSTETQLAYSAITSKGSVSDFNHRVWNDMCYKCREILAALGYGNEGSNGWNDYYLDFEDTLMHTGNSVMTANRFNSLRYNIGSRIIFHWSFDPDSDIQPGKPVRGRYFTELTDALDTWIDSI